MPSFTCFQLFIQKSIWPIVNSRGIEGEQERDIEIEQEEQHEYQYNAGST